MPSGGYVCVTVNLTVEYHKCSESINVQDAKWRVFRAVELHVQKC